MAATIIAHSNVGAPIANASATSGAAGLVWGIYDMTSTENSDYIVLSEFTSILYVMCKSISSGALTDEAVTIDASTANKLVFTAGGTDDIRVFVIGTPA